jgi:hypothetical protein
MPRFNAPGTRAAVRSPVATGATASGLTREGGPGFARDPKSELFLLAVSHMGGRSFYESAPERDSRLRALAGQVATADPEWLGKFVPWLRDSAQMRTASVVVAAEAARALLLAGRPGGRQVVASALQRADEPGELLAYWTARYGRAVPKPVKRGIGDALFRLYSEYPLMKYDTGTHAYRFADVLAITHPGDRRGSSQGGRFQGDWQRDLFGFAVGRRYGRDVPPEALAMIAANRRLRQEAAGSPSALLDPGRLKAAGMTWEDALSLAGPKVSKRALWTALAPVLGYMAVIRNLRNMDEAGVPDGVAATLAARISDPEQVRRSRQFPFRFLSAYRAVPSLRWSWPLEQALGHSLANVPALRGRTLVLVDTSTSMEGEFSGFDGTLARWDIAVLFGAAVALRCESADIVSFSGRSYYHEPQVARTRQFPLRPAESLLAALTRWRADGYFLGGGTDTALALQASFRGHDRVIIVTDEQAAGNGTEVSRAIPESVPLYTWNLAGERYGHAPSGLGTRHTFGGLTDHAFRLIPMLEAGRDARWDDLFAAREEPAG